MLTEWTNENETGRREKRVTNVKYRVGDLVYLRDGCGGACLGEVVALLGIIDSAGNVRMRYCVAWSLTEEDRNCGETDISFHKNDILGGFANRKTM